VRRWVNIVLILVVILLLMILIGPLVIPIPPLQGTLPPERLADSDSQFIKLKNVNVHYKQTGEGQPALLLLHGFGASTFSWREVIRPLAKFGTVIVYDRPAFGLTERPLKWTGENPYSPEFQAEMVLALMDAHNIRQAILVGNSAGGTVSVLAALNHPERVKALILVDPAIYQGRSSSSLLNLLLQTPQAGRIGPLLVRSIQESGNDILRRAWHDPSRITPEIWDGYRRPLEADNWDRGLWEFTRASRPLGLDKRLSELKLPVLVITGDDDRIVPTQSSIRLAGELPNAKLVVIPNCGHVPHEECPQAFMQAVAEFLNSIW
jgi:pimeloyl-ACP methyl ester carboxylesterase